jgi:diadenosine tetraphosphate (Ap4A) HIT family hydrolase
MGKVFMHNPERKKYTKGERPNGECYFCEGRPDQLLIKDYKHWSLVANKFPFIDYGVLAIPHRHFEFVDETTEEEHAELQTIWNEVLGAWRKHYLGERERTQQEVALDNDKPSWNLMAQRHPVVEVDEEPLPYINNGEHSGRTVPHLHWNIVPRIYIRRTGYEIMGHFQKVKMTPEETQELFKRLLDEKT